MISVECGAAECARCRALEAEIVLLRDQPEIDDFDAGTRIEAMHQVARWGAEHDAGKSPFDWFWLIGYLSQKAAAAAVAGDLDKAKHHTISTAGALRNWHRALAGIDQRMRPGIDPVERGLGEREPSPINVAIAWLEAEAEAVRSGAGLAVTETEASFAAQRLRACADGLRAGLHLPDAAAEVAHG